MRISGLFILLAIAPLQAAAGTAHVYGILNADGKPEGRPVLDLSAPGIVFYCLPGEARCAKALEEISGDTAAGAALFTRAFFITGPANAEAAAEWNAAHRQQFAVMYSTADWPEFDAPAAPAIQFYSGGKSVCAIKGWRGRAAAGFTGCLKKARLLTLEARLESATMLTRLENPQEDFRKEELALAAAEGRALVKEGAFALGALPAYDKRALKNAYALTSSVNFYFPTAGMLDIQTAILAELEKRGLANEFKVRQLHERLLDNKLFAAGEAIRAGYPAYDLQKVPQVTGSPEIKEGEAGLYATDGETSLELQKVPKKATRIVIAASPGCHFAQNALEEIDKDPELSPVFARHALLLTSKVDMASLKKWNTEHRLQYRITANDADWPGVDFSLSPSFYFLKDGIPVYSIPGWSNEGFLDSISGGIKLLFPDMKLSRKPAGKEAKKEDGRPGRRKVIPARLGDFIKGLSKEQTRRFCAGLRYQDGTFTGAEMEDVLAVFGQGRAAAINAYLGGKTEPGARPAGKKLGELWSKLDTEGLNHTCGTINYHNGHFGGFNYRDVADAYGDKGVDEGFAFFTPAKNGKDEEKK